MMIMALVRKLLLSWGRVGLPQPLAPRQSGDSMRQPHIVPAGMTVPPSGVMALMPFLMVVLLLVRKVVGV